MALFYSKIFNIFLNIQLFKVRYIIMKILGKLINRQYLVRMSFATAKQKNLPTQQQQKLTFINNNLKFDARDYQLYLTPLHPKIVQHNSAKFQIIAQSPVLLFNFVKKTDNEEQFVPLWQKRNVFQFQFSHLHKILAIRKDSTNPRHKETSINVKNIDNNIQKQTLISFIANQQNQQIEFISKEKIMLKGEDQPNYQIFKTAINFESFEEIQSIIKQISYDLSGLRALLQVQKMNQIEKFKAESKSSQSAKEMYQQ